MSFEQIDRINLKLEKQEFVYGTSTAWGGAHVAEMFGEAGFDILWIDNEHGALDNSTLMQTLIGARASNMAALVRIPWNKHYLAKAILDMGADGIIFPMVMNAKEAEMAVAACRYPPEGIRGFGPGRAAMYGAMDIATYLQESRKQWTAVQIEHIDAVKHLDEILKVEGIDLFIVGPGDLSGSMGYLAQTDRPEVRKVLDEIVYKIKAAGKRVGTTFGYNDRTFTEWLERGTDIIFCGSDLEYLYAGARDRLADMRHVVSITREG